MEDGELKQKLAALMEKMEGRKNGLMEEWHSGMDDRMDGGTMEGSGGVAGEVEGVESGRRGGMSGEWPAAVSHSRQVRV